MDNDDILNEINRSLWQNFIEVGILQYVVQAEIEHVRSRAETIVAEYHEYDMDVLKVLANAVKYGRFDEFADRLEYAQKNNFCYDSPNAKIRTAENVYAQRKQLLEDCCAELRQEPPEAW